MTFHPTVVAVVDIGSPAAGRLGWYAAPAEEGGQDVDRLMELLADGLVRGPCALGFEAPMYVPYRPALLDLTKARPGEGNRAWSAGAGAGALATGLVVVPHLLRRLREKAPNATATVDWKHPPTRPGELLLFEAFVSGKSKGTSHADDACIAVRSFEAACANLYEASKLQHEDCFGLLGAALLRTGWTDDLSVLKAGVLVVGS
jgi:hypothetical protein